MKRNFTPEAPNHLWVAHITYVRTWEGWLYLALPRLRAGHLLKEGPRLVHDEQPQNRARARCLENMAIYNRRPQPGLIHHSDRGSQYTSVEFGSRLKEAGLLPSMGSVADAYDNSMAESFVSTLKRELIHRHAWPSPQMVWTAFLQNTSKASTILDVGTPRWVNLSPSKYEEVRLRGGAVA